MDMQIKNEIIFQLSEDFFMLHLWIKCQILSRIDLLMGLSASKRPAYEKSVKEMTEVRHTTAHACFFLQNGHGMAQRK